MFQPVGAYLPHLMTLGVLAFVVSRQILAKRRADRRSAEDAYRIARGLRMELQTLRQLYGDNLNLLDRGGKCLMSVRSATSFYRSNSGKLGSLFDETTLGCVVGAFAANEKLEAHLSCACIKPNGSFAYQVAPLDTRVRQLRERFMSARKNVRQAIRALDSFCATAKPANAEPGTIAVLRNSGSDSRKQSTAGPALIPPAQLVRVTARA